MLDWNCWKSNSSSTSTSDRVTAATAINVTRFIWKEVRVTCMTCRIYDFWQLNYDDIFFFLGSFVPFACFVFTSNVFHRLQFVFPIEHSSNHPSTSSLLVHFWLGCLCYLIFFGYFLFVLLYIFIIIFFIFIYFFLFFSLLFTFVMEKHRYFIKFYDMEIFYQFFSGVD